MNKQIEINIVPVFIIIMIGFIGLAAVHEQVHVAIFATYGVESRIEWIDNFPDVSTISEGPCPNNSCIFAHHINEAITYPLMILYAIASLLYLLSIQSSNRIEREKTKNLRDYLKN